MKSIAVELISDADCPNVEQARDNLRVALNEVGLPAHWWEVVRGAGAPAHALGFGSPTVLVNGEDVSPSPEPSASNCRIYPRAKGGFDRAPSATVIAAALRNAIRR